MMASCGDVIFHGACANVFDVSPQGRHTDVATETTGVWRHDKIQHSGGHAAWSICNIPYINITMAERKQSFETTYRESFKAEKNLPPLKFYQAPSFQLVDEPTLPPREFPLIPRGPHRRLRIDTPPGLGLGTSDVRSQDFLDAKPIVGTDPPRQINHSQSGCLLKRRKSAKGKRCPTPVRPRTPNLSAGRPRTPKKASNRPCSPKTSLLMRKAPGSCNLLPCVEPLTSEKVDEICKRVTWTTTQKRDTEAAARLVRKVKPPSSTFEENADMVKYRPAKYENKRELWQEVASEWDHVQTRPKIDKPVEYPGAKLNPSGYMFTRKKELSKTFDKEIQEIAKANQLSSTYTRKCPGYAGFVPRSPIEAPPKARETDPRKKSIMKSSYRGFPADEYRILEFAHKGPMSHTVTLTYPYNPFNKLEQRLM